MTEDHRFCASKYPKLDDPGRLVQMNPTALWDALAEPEAAVMVDIGAGTGIISEAFIEIAPGLKVYAADTAHEAIAWMREHRGQVATGELVPVLSDDGHVPLPDGIADVAITISLHHELDEPVALYREALRLLRPGGRLLVADWRPIETPKGPPLAARVSAEDIAAAVVAAGFEDARMHDILAEHSVVTATRPR